MKLAAKKKTTLVYRRIECQ